jgi:hypothetical protein
MTMAAAVRVLEALGAGTADGTCGAALAGLGPRERALVATGDSGGLAGLLGAPRSVMMQLWAPQEDRPEDAPESPRKSPDHDAPDEDAPGQDSPSDR